MKRENASERKKRRLLKKQLISIQRQLKEGSEMTAEASSPVVHFSSGSYIASMGGKKTKGFPLAQRTDSLWGTVENPDLHFLQLQSEERLRLEKEAVEAGLKLESSSYLADVPPPDNDNILAALGEDATVSQITEDDQQNSRKSKLNSLSAYVNSHTCRKLLSQWNAIMTKFEASSINMQMKVNSSVVPSKALYISDLMLLLCSPKIKIKVSELSSMCADFKIPVGIIQHARKIAAVKLMMHLNEIDPNFSHKKAAQLSVRMQVLTRTEETIVSIEQIKNWCFPKDPLEITKVTDKIEADKLALLQENIEEREKKKQVAERAELRLLKATKDYKSALSEIQFSKGPLSLTRLYSLRNVFDFCAAAIKEASAEHMLVVPIAVLDLIGRDVFPEVVVNASLSQEENRGALLLNRSSKDKNPVPTTFCDGNSRILLQGPPAPFLKMIWETAVILGKGLNGFSYRDVVELLQAYAATRVQAIFRGKKMRKRYKFLKRLRMKVSGAVKQKNFVAFKELTRRNVDQRLYCWRKVKVWGYYTKYLLKIHNFFRSCFWPFYVWRRWSCKNKTAKEKARFLVGRVYPAYLQIKVYRAWYRYIHLQASRKKIADEYLGARLRKKAASSFIFYHKWAKQKKSIRRRWFKEGILRLQRAIEAIKFFPLVIWKTCIFYKKCVNLRVRNIASSFRVFLFKDKPVYIPPSITQIREAIKKAAAEKEAARSGALKAISFDDNIDDELHSAAEREENPFDAETEEEVYHWAKTLPKRKTYLLSVEIDFDTDVIIRERKSQEEILVENCTTSRETGNSASKNNIEYYLEKKKLNIIDKVYNTNFDDLISPQDIQFLSSTDSFIRNKCSVLHLRAKEAEKLALIELSFRYHRNIKRVFRNLRHHAIISRNAYNSSEFYRLKRMKVAFDGFVRWTNRLVFVYQINLKKLV